VPFFLDADPAGGPGVLRAHVARANPVWKEARSDVESLVVFQGAQCYVSPAWYPSKAEHGKVVPTWNYVIVLGRGTVRFIDDAEVAARLRQPPHRRHEGERAARDGQPRRGR
jgi:transcriptional regulator